MLIFGALHLIMMLFIIIYLALYISGKRKTGIKGKRHAGKLAAIAAIPAYLLIVTLCFFTSPSLYRSDNASSNEPKTIIVLGCPANEDGTPGITLKSRLDKALEISHQYPDYPIIVTGAAAHNTQIEAEVMKRYLVENGIRPQQVYLEPQARNTFENAVYSIEIMTREKLGEPIIVTSHFHLRRSRKIFSRHLNHFSIATPQPGFGEYLATFPVYVMEAVMTAGTNIKKPH